METAGQQPAASTSVGASVGLSDVVAKRHAAGLSIRAIARELDVGRERARAIAKELGLDSDANRSYRPPETGPKISAAKRGRKRPDQSERLRQRHREQGHAPPEERSCERCAGCIGLVHVSQGRRFCSLSCAALWRWETEDDHPLRRNLRYGGQGAREFLCAICRHRTVVRWPSQVEAAGGEQKARFICSTCDPLWREAVMRARQVLRRCSNRRSVSNRLSVFSSRNGDGELLRTAAEIACAFELAVRTSSREKQGRRPPLAADLLIEAAHREGFTDRCVCAALNWLRSERTVTGDPLLQIAGVRQDSVLDVEYVKQRRERTNIWRRAPQLRGVKTHFQGVETLF